MRLRKTILNWFLYFLGITVFKSPVILKMIGKKYFGLNQIDRELASILNFDDGFYVEIGANDGNTQSNTKYFELFRNWRGILIEPVPKTFKKLKKNRSSNNCFVNSACTSFDGPSELTLLYSNLMTSSIGSDDEKYLVERHAKSGLKHLSGYERVHEITVPSVPLQNILLHSGAPKIVDFLSLDVEGFEVEVLKGINHRDFRFKYILVESECFKNISDYFQSIGYIYMKSLSYHDYLFRDASTLTNDI